MRRSFLNDAGGQHFVTSSLNSTPVPSQANEDDGDCWRGGEKDVRFDPGYVLNVFSTYCISQRVRGYRK